jgi:hypothetical protein
MRSPLAKLAFAMSAFAIIVTAGLLTAAPAQAEKRVFVIANDGDSYGVDRCLASGAACGAAAAAAYCRAREFAQAASYRKVDREEFTGATLASVSDACRGSACRELVAIECMR